MTRTIIVRRNYAHFIKKYSRSAAVLLVMNSSGSKHMFFGQSTAFCTIELLIDIHV